MSTSTLPQSSNNMSEGNVRDMSAISLRFPPTPPKSEYNVTEASLSSSESNSRRTSLEPESNYTLPPPSNPPTRILKEDLKTPDNHVPRDPRLIRLTGIHPFNVEPPLSALYNEGFLTSPELFYVRNHGAVPQVDDASIPDWEFSIEGLVKHPITMSLKQLIAEYEQITVPVTLVCAGNRRKEQNQVRQSKGFSWGAAGVSTALWTGVAIGDLIKRAMPMRGAKYLCMEGADKLPNGYYGTSVKLNWAMDPNRGIMLAHKMNGETLTPDHGKPLRVIIPGQIGGRSVKWLKRIIITAAPSDNWYHIYDNRVLPTMVTPEMGAADPTWWTDERYAIYDLSTNSATAYPAHDEQISLVNGPESYKVRGYAYGGGGRRITRVEVTLDKGKSWALANIKYHEDEYREAAEDDMLFGGRIDMGWRETCFAWCFWDIELKVSDMVMTGDIMVRAMDESMNVQPREMYWSVLGMMNNPWYRITVTKEGDNLRFDHPTQPALMPGGWMEKTKARGGNLANGFWGESLGGAEEVVEVEEKKVIKMTKDGLNRLISIDELREHENDENPWFVVNGEVYDGLPFLEGHPGGATSIIGAAGQDATEEFMAIHSETAKAMMESYHIGSLDLASRAILALPPTPDSESTTPRPIFLQPKTWSSAVLTSKRIISRDSRIFTFSLDHAAQSLGLPTGKHLMLRLRDPVTNDAIIRSYTPLSEGHAVGTLEILIKVYFAEGERAGGKMTMALDMLELGKSVDMKGPTGHFEYLGHGRCSIHDKIRTVKRFIMICGGSGITPIFQVLRSVLQNKDDETRCLVLDGNREEEDILCRGEMDDLVHASGDKCTLIHTLSKPSEEWKGLKGRVGKELLESEVGAFDSEKGDLVLVCGPEALEKGVKTILGEMGWADSDLVFF